jgi:hypothetical protein
MTEPVAYINVEERKLEWASPIKWETSTVVKMDKVPLYTASPQRDEASAKAAEWVGLTDEEVGMLTVFDGLHHVEVPLLAKFIRAIEAKLKEKNT